MKTIIRELIRCAALIYLLGAPWSIVSSRVEGLGVVLLLAGILPAGSFLFGALKKDLEVSAPSTAVVATRPQLRLVPGSAATSMTPRVSPDSVARATREAHQARPRTARIRG